MTRFQGESDPQLRSRKRAGLALALLLLAVVPALWGQVLLVEGRAIGWLGSMLGVVMVFAACRLFGRPPKPWVEPPRDLRLARRWWMLIPGILFGVIAWWLQLRPNVDEPRVLVFWFFALACLLVPYLIPDRRDSSSERQAVVRTLRQRGPELVAVLLLMGVALAFRLPHLERFPAAVHNDEASCGLMGQQVLERRAAGEQHWFRSCDGFWHFPSMGFFPSAAGQAMTGTNLYGHRLANVVLAMVTLLCLYSLVRSIFGTSAALVALGLAATAHVAVHWSRSGIHSGHATWLTVICAWIAWRAISTGKLQYFVLLGFSCAVCLLTYSAAYLVPIWIGLVVTAGWLASPRFRKGFTMPLAVTGFSAIVFFAPMIAEYQKHPETFFNRASMMVWTNDPASVAHMSAEFDGDFRRAIVKRNWQRTILLPHTTDDSNLQYGNRDIALVDSFTAVVLVLGLGVALASLTQVGHWPLLLVLALNVLLGAVFPMDGVQYSRIAGMAVIIMVVPALWGRQLVVTARASLGRAGPWLMGVALGALLVVAGHANYRHTFFHFDQLNWSSAVPRTMTLRAVLAQNIRDWGTDNITFVHTSLPTEFWERTYQLIAGDRSMVAFDSVEALDMAATEGFETITFVVATEAEELIPVLESRYPGGERLEVNVKFHEPADVGWVYRVRRAAR